MSQPRDNRQDDLFGPPLKEIINLRHPLVRLAGEIDWDFLAGRFRSVCRVGPGQPPLPTRLVAGLFIIKHMHNLSDEALCDRWVENPYFQYFCGEAVFRHELPFDRRHGRIIRDIRRKIDGNTVLEDRFGPLLDLAPPRGASARAEDLFAARARGGVHRPRQGAGAVRVRLQGLNCNVGHCAQRRAIRAACQSDARQPL
jgi:hypothetical protein